MSVVVDTIVDALGSYIDITVREPLSAIAKHVESHTRYSYPPMHNPLRRLVNASTNSNSHKSPEPIKEQELDSIEKVKSVRSRYIGNLDTSSSS